MFRRFSVNFALFSIILDSALILVMLSASTHLRPLLGFLPFAADYPKLIPMPLIIYPVFALEWVSILALFSIYNGLRRMSALEEFINLTLGSILAMAALAGTLYLSFREISRLLFASFIVLTYISMLFWRMIFRVVYQRSSEGFSQQRRVLILGAGSVGRELENQIKENHRFSLRVVGFLDDRFENQGADVLGTLDSLQSVTSKHHPDDVVIALPKQDYAQTEKIISELHHLPVRVWLIPDYFRLALHKAAVEDFAGIPMLDLRAPALSEGQRLIKRAFDLTITILSLPFALALMGLAAIAIRLDSQGSILFGQRRLGENGRLFTMYKFRTMRPGAEELRYSVEEKDEHGRLLHKKAGDPRVTRIGRILRRSSLDELPQLFNVLKGEMSLVGPRPELPYMADRYETWQRQRFAAPQGITGWWQVNGRSDRPMHLNTEDDLYYIQHYSLFLDIYILFKTINVVMQGKGAF